MGKSDPLLLLDNGTLAYILGNGEYRFTSFRMSRRRGLISARMQLHLNSILLRQEPSRSCLEMTVRRQ